MKWLEPLGKSKCVKTRAAIARRFKVTPQAVAKWFLRDDFPYKAKSPRVGFTISVIATWRSKRKRERAKKQVKSAPPPPSPAQVTYESARARDMSARAEINALKAAKMRGQAMPREVFDAACVALAVAFREHLRDLVEMYPERLAGLDSIRLSAALVEYRERVHRDLFNLAAITIDEADLRALKPHPGRPNAARVSKHRRIR